MIDNILSNAIKYNKIGGLIRIDVHSKSLSIKDSGVGIEEAKLGLVFERYSRFNTSVGGFGIGLNIVALIAKEYDLHVNISSQLNKGTEVIISW